MWHLQAQWNTAGVLSCNIDREDRYQRHVFAWSALSSMTSIAVLTLQAYSSVPRYTCTLAIDAALIKEPYISNVDLLEVEYMEPSIHDDLVGPHEQ